MQAWDSSGQAHDPSESVTSGNHAVYTMENILSSLNSLAEETWLTFGSASYHIDLNYTLLGVLGLLLLYICYLILKLVLQSLWKKKYTHKLQEKAKETRGALEGEGTFQRAEERRKLQTIRQSPLGELYDATRYEQLLHPDPLFIVSHSTTSKVSHLLSQATLQDGAVSRFCLASTAPVTETSFILSTQLTVNPPGHSAPAIPHGPLPLTPSILSPNPFVPLESLLSSTTLGDFLIPESMLPGKPKYLPDSTPPYALDSFTLPTKAQESKVVFQLESTRSLVSRHSEVPAKVSATKGSGYVSQAVSASSQRWPAADRLLSSDSEYSFHQHLPTPHASQASLQGDFLEPGNLLPPSSDALAQIQRQEKKGGDFLTTKYKEHREVFLRSSHSLEKPSLAQSLSKPQDLAASHSASTKGNHTHSKTSDYDAEPKPTQLFWGPPSLHSEALQPPTTTSYDHPSTIIGFNSMAAASIADGGSPVVTLPTPLFETKSQPQTWEQAPAQCHFHHDPPAQTQPPSPVPVLILSPESQLRICGVHFHRHQEEAPPLGPSETQHLEYNILKKEQERVWGLPSVVQKSQDSFCPSPPKFSLTSQCLKSHPPRPVLLGDFPITEELRKKLEHHLRKRLIQHRWGLPHRINVSLSLMCPQSELVDFSESESSHGLSWISVFKHRGNKNSHGIVLSGSGRFRSGASETHPREEAEVTAQTYRQDIGQKVRLQSNLQEAPVNSLKSDLKRDQESQLGQLSNPSQVRQYQKRIENALEEHLNKKIKEIYECQIPGTVKRSWHSINVAQPALETPPRQLKYPAPLAGEEDPLEKQQYNLSFSPSKEKMLEEHIKTFSKRMTFGLPQRVEESLDTYMTKVEPAHPLSHPPAPPHTAPGASSRLLQRNTSGHRMKMSSKPIQDAPLLASSPVSQRQPASENKQTLVDKDLSIAQNDREAVQPWTPSMVDKGSLRQSGSDNRHSPELPMRPDGPTDERLASSINTQGPQEERGSFEAGSMTEGSTELLKGEEPPGLHPQSTKILTAIQGTCSPGSHGTTCQSLQGMSVPHNHEISDYESQVSREVVLHSESGPLIQAAGPPNVPSASEEMTSKRQGPFSGDMTASQVLRVHLPTVGVSVEPLQGPWFPACVSDKCQNKQCPPAANGVPPLTTEAGKFGGGDACLGTSQTRGKRPSVEAKAPAETHGRTSSPVPSPERHPPESQFNSQVRCFGQWMSPGRKLKGEERPLTKGSSPSPSVKITGLIRGRYEFYGNTETQKYMRDPRVILKKLEPRHGTVIPCPEETQKEIQPQAQTEPLHRHHSWGQAVCSQEQRAESCSPGQGQPAPESCGIAGKSEMVTTFPMHASQGTWVPPKSYL
ncbi:hypothetical protein HispidOSU_031696 [Sigmodon hispidus]